MRPRLALATLTLLSLVPGARAEEPPALRLWYTQPAVRWTDALPIGNGRMGAMVFGGVPDERIQFNEDTLWKGQPHDYDRPDAGRYLNGIRQLIWAGKPKEAERLARAHFLGDPVRQMPYQPFGDLHLHFAGLEKVTDYRRSLDLDSAVATVTYRAGGVTYRREAFASYPDHVIVLRITADQPGHITLHLTMDSPHPDSRTAALAPDTLALSGRVGAGGLRFESQLRVTSTGGQASADAQGVTVTHADAVTFLLAAATSFKNFHDISADPAARCAAVLAALKGRSFASLLAVHEQDYRRLFDRVSLELGPGPDLSQPRAPAADRHESRASALPTAGPAGGLSSRKPARGRSVLPTDERLGQVQASGLAADPALAALYFQFGRYLLIASSRPGGQPANLQGLWNESLDPPWESKWTTNINLEMNYWPAEVTNLTECNGPLFDLIDDLTVTGHRTARDYYGCDGWVLHHNTDLWRATAPCNNIEGVWPTGGAWLCDHLWEHYLFTRDREFLARRAYPVMKSAAQFFVGDLVRDPQTGWLVTSPSYSPEHGDLTAGPTMDEQLVRALFEHTAAAAALLGVDRDFAANLTRLCAQLAPNQIGRHGQLQEWLQDIDRPNDTHRHLSPLWALYPGNDITPADPKIFAAAKKLLTWRGDGSTGWSYAWRIALWARAYDGDEAYRQLSGLLQHRTLPNLLDLGGPFQIDGNFGGTAGIAELLLQSQLTVPGTEGTPEIDLLPALPGAWPSGAVRGLCARGGFTVDLAWSHGVLTRATIHSKLGTPCRLRYRASVVDLTTRPGETLAFDGHLRPIR